MDHLTLIFLFVTAVLAGLVDTMAGGGGLITVPVLLSSGLPPVNALAVNKFQGSFGVLTASWRFWRLGMIDIKKMILPFVTTLIGAAIGAFIVTKFDPAQIKKLVPILLLAVAVYFILSPKLPHDDRQPRLSWLWLILGCAPVIGFYDGLIGPGTGSFFMLALTALFGFSLRNATAQTKILNLASNISALCVFILGNHVIWAPAIVMALGQMIGAVIGARLVIGRAAVLIKPMIVIMCVLMSIRLLTS